MFEGSFYFIRRERKERGDLLHRYKFKLDRQLLYYCAQFSVNSLKTFQ